MPNAAGEMEKESSWLGYFHYTQKKMAEEDRGKRGDTHMVNGGEP